MDTSPKKVSANFLSISGSQALGLLFNLVSFGLIARYLTVENFGNFSLLLAIVGILSKLIDLGISPIVFRESSDSDKKYNFLNTAIGIRLVAFIIIQVLANTYLIIQNLSSQQIILFNILMLSIIFSAKMANFRDLFAIPFKVKLAMSTPSILSVLDSLVFLLAVIIMPLVKGGLLYLTIAYVFSNLPGFIILLIYLVKKYNVKFHPTLKNAKWLMKESAPLAGFVLFMSLFQQMDILLLKEISNSYATGIYSSAIRLVLPLNLIPNAMVTTVFPILIRKEIKREILIKSVYKALFFLSVAIAVIFAFKAEELISLVFGGKYIVAGRTTIILFISQIFMFLNFFSLSVFTADKKQKRNFFYAVLLVFVNVIVDLTLIPLLSYEGAAIAKLVAAITGFIYTFILIRKSKNTLNFLKSKQISWSILLILSMYILSNFHLVVYLTGSLIALSIITIITKFFSQKEIDYFVQIIK